MYPLFQIITTNNPHHLMPTKNRREYLRATLQLSVQYHILFLENTVLCVCIFECITLCLCVECTTLCLALIQNGFPHYFYFYHRQSLGILRWPLVVTIYSYPTQGRMVVGMLICLPLCLFVFTAIPKLTNTSL